MANRLTIYFTSDTHGYLYPTSFAYAAPRPMGLLAMRFPKDGNTLVIDGGDTLQGSPLSYYCHSQALPMPMARVMNDLQYDYVTLGNHDFNYGYAPMREYLDTLNATCLCANVRDLDGRLPLGSFAVHTLQNGTRVGLFGVVTDWVTNWETPETLARFAITDPLESAREAVAQLRSQCDILVGIYHGGFEKELDTEKPLSNTDENIACRLCEELPLDILLTGHQHIAIANRTYRGTHVVQTPCNATAYVKLTVDAQGGMVSELLTPGAQATLKPWQAKLLDDLNAWLDKPIGRLSHALWPRDKLHMALHGSPIANFINQVQLSESGADISCTALGNEIRGFDSMVTVRDVVASYTYANTLVVLEVTGQQVRQALEQCATYFAVRGDGSVAVADAFLRPKAAHYNYDYFWGITYAFDLRKPAGCRVAALMRAGETIADGARFSLVTNSYRATGAGDFDAYAHCPRLREIQTDVSELILNYLRERTLVEVDCESAYDVTLPDGKKA